MVAATLVEMGWTCAKEEWRIYWTKDVKDGTAR